ncbi:MAG: MMPL family transporter [Flavobacterium sp.]|jgi:predicted RND superfamily exporter protein|uniref:efflux RND transporter permease subunit n=1 Tax=Flavobacterium sp. TaxID=239 RepID=UPI002B49923C|nr:MMPL family transporter [Flavobacterium sp.]WRH72177.1 MAG: MMPL family transporter [Flavobacterium sp.]
MLKWLSTSFWDYIASRILRNKIGLLVLVALFTLFMASQWKYIKFTNTEANLLPASEKANIEYNSFLEKFGEEGNLIVIGIQDSLIFSPKIYASWEKLMLQLKQNKEVDVIISLNDLKRLQKNDSLSTFELTSLLDPSKTPDAAYLKERQKELLTQMPFYEGLLYNKSGIIRSAIYLDKKIVNTPERKNLVLQKIIPAIETFENETKVDLHVSGMPYIRSLNSEYIISEISLFIGAALGITSLIFFFFFRSFRTTLISMCIVVVGVMWSFGFLGLLRYEITVLTALVPTLMIVIGIPNCIFLTNKYHQECRIHGNQAKALVRVITKVGTPTLITNLTTSFGFATFIVTNNELLKEFGVVTSINIIALFFLCLFVIPVAYSYMSIPKERHLDHLERSYAVSFLNWIQKTIKSKRIIVYIVAFSLLATGIFGIFKMKISGSLIEDMPKKAAFYDDIVFFEKEFDGVMPIEIMIDTKKKKGVMKLTTLKRMDELQETIDSIPELSKPISIVNLVKYSKQAYYNNNPDYYELPSSQEQAFILSFAKNSVKNSKDNIMKSYVDETGQYTRITTFIKDDGINNLDVIESKLQEKIDELFPKERYEVSITGKAVVFQKGTKYLLDNLLQSLLLSVFITALLIAFMFRSIKMIIVALVPNLLPLLMTAGIMGYFNIPLKPSTILVFGIAFGLSVDDTIRFLAEYRQSLTRNNWKIKKSVFATINESGLSMFYTSVVLFSGFSVFMLSSFGGTIALGGLVSITLLFGMLSNLVLLPSLVLTLNKTLANQQEFVEPTINILSDEEVGEIDKIESNEFEEEDIEEQNSNEK